jgi:FkbM family methyltransferase
MADKQPDMGVISPKPGAELVAVVRRLAAALPLVERRALAMTLIESEADEVKFRRGGATWTIALWDKKISQFLFANENFQGKEIRAVLKWMRRNHRFAAPRDCIVDVGANIGTSTIPFAQATDCRVTAIEPTPEPFALLTRNVADNGLAQRVTCVRSAIVNGPAEVVRMVFPVDNSGGAEVVRPGGSPSFAGLQAVRGEARAPAAGLSATLERHGVAPERVAFVWSDTQGCEIDVIESGRALWAAGAPLFAEFDPSVCGAAGLVPLAAAAVSHFTAFIPAEALIDSAAVAARPIAELPAYCRSLGERNSDCLLLP